MYRVVVSHARPEDGFFLVLMVMKVVGISSIYAKLGSYFMLSKALFF